MDDLSNGFIGEEIVTDQDDGKVAKPRGFADPEILAKAQEARRQNRTTTEAVDAPGDGTGSGTGKRGRPRKAATKADLEGIVMMLVGIHSLLSVVTGFADLTIDNEEAGLLAKALANLAEHHKIKIDGKTSAYIGFVYAIATVYGPRAILIRNELRARNKGKQDGSPVVS